MPNTSSANPQTGTNLNNSTGFDLDEDFLPETQPPASQEELPSEFGDPVPPPNQGSPTPDDTDYGEIRQVVSTFGEEFEPFLPSDRFKVLDFMKGIQRDNTPPQNVNPWECRIGLSKFLIPPINMAMRKVSNVTSVGGGLRTQSSPKFNSGHAETMLSLTLYFPTHQSIWGINGEITAPNTETDTVINFDEDSDSIVDTYAASLRGLIAQFKYSPFLPIKNAHINGALDIKSVALQSMEVSTIEGYPFALSVQLNMLKFNHEVYLPMVEDLDQGIHWGRFRQYIGRGAIKLSSMVDESFLTGKVTDEEFEAALEEDSDPYKIIKESIRKYDISNSGIGTFNTRKEWNTGSNFDIYYPTRTPARIPYPDLTFFKDPGSKGGNQRRNWWQSIISEFGFDYASTPQAAYEDVNTFWAGPYGQKYIADEARLLTSFLSNAGKTFREMGSNEMQLYIENRKKNFLKDNPNTSFETLNELEVAIKSSWFAVMYRSLTTDPALEKQFAYQEYLTNVMLIKEWEVPMSRLDIDPNTCFVQSVSVGLGNNLVKMQLQMNEEPAYQHIGTLDTTAQINMLVYGDEAITKITRAIKHVNGLSRLTKGHGSIGFYGVKNIITALCGMKYAMISEINTASVPNYPGVYSLSISFVDFDVFQQKREMLSSSQQLELMDAFSKRNPFLRLKQHPAAANCYPDMPLSVKDNDGRILGYLDPDYYFRSFDTVDPDITNYGELDPKAHYTFMCQEDDEEAAVGLIIGRDGLEFLDGNQEPKGEYQNFWEPNADQMCSVEPHVKGLTVLKDYVQPYIDGKSSPDAQFQSMITDMAFRDNSGRMVRAFPTYMLWVIDEGGKYAGVKLFDNFYGLQSVLDIASVQSEDSMDDTLVIQLSNIYSRLSLDYSGLLDETTNSNAKIINTQINRARKLKDGFQEFVTELETINLSPGVRIHLRLGYSANPNNLTTIFNGTITEVEQGEVVTITCQSDTAELSSIINAKDPKGDTGKVDGSLFGSMYFSEPRDLMTRLLTMGSSTAREMISRASGGQIFSENRFGIRHFGMILTDAMTGPEKENQDKREAAIQVMNDKLLDPTGFAEKAGDGISDLFGGGIIGGALSFATKGLLSSSFGAISTLSFGMFELFSKMSTNLGRNRDFELFKRNIYPGNGTGLTQYMGGDFGDGGMVMGVEESTGITDDADFNLDVQAPADLQVIFDKYNEGKQTIEMLERPNGVMAFIHPMGEFFGLTRETNDDDVDGADEVSFRAFTYMKSVWDIFQTCAALLPNYIVAVRPFEDRSTVFYGKPHWNWTSAVIPITKGTPKIDISASDDEWAKIAKDMADQMAADREEDLSFYDKINADMAESMSTTDASGALTGLPTGMKWDGTKIEDLPITAMGVDGQTQVSLPVKSGTGCIEMHLPTAPKNQANVTLAEDIASHIQGDWLPKELRHPWYMDRAINNGTSGETSDHGGRGGYVDLLPYDENGTILEGDDASWPGTFGCFSRPMPPEEEMWYVAFRWPGKGKQYKGLRPPWGKGKRIMVYSNRTKKGVICTPGDYGPHGDTARQFGISPEGSTYLDLQIGTDVCQFGFVDDDAPLGPVDFGDGGGSVVAGASVVGFGPPESVSDAPAGADANTVRDQKIISKADAMASFGGDTAGHWDPETGLPVFFMTSEALKRRELKDGSYDTDLHAYAKKWGATDSDIPVDYSNPEYSIIDPIGSKARLVWQHEDIQDNLTKSEEQANNVWDQFRDDFANEDIVKKAIDRAFPALKLEGGTFTFQPDFSDAKVKQINEDRKALMDAFKEYMWTHPYNRGWLIKTADKQTRAGSVIETLNPVGNLPFVGGWANSVVDGAADAFNKGWDFMTGRNDAKREWNFDAAHKVFEAFLSDPSGNKAKEAMLNNAGPGNMKEGVIGIALDQFHDKVWRNVVDVFRGIFSAVGAALSGVVNLIRMSLMVMSNGLQMGAYNQKQSNLLNKTYNDSIYYSAGPPGTLSYYVDNPFTREYHEPVVEVREPFQKLHKVSSFREILDNKITEVTGVPTVITATSNGGNPVTVHFDKAAPSDRQVEQTVETGLKWQKPDGPPILKYIMHPIKTLESFATRFNNGDQETSAKRVALWFLKESLKDIYSGEITIIGDASIRPHDLLYISDPFTSIFGLCEVEQVVHHFNAEMGFVTSITPNAIVTINDPVKWTVTEHIRQRMNTASIREGLKHTYGGQAGGYSHPESYELNQVAQTLAPYFTGALSYTGGNTALIKDFAGASNVGMLRPAGDQAQMMANLDNKGAITGGINDYFQEAAPPVLGDGPGTAAARVIGYPFLWAGWSWVKDNLMDQQSCYIQYLSKNGRPMDAGLYFNRGVAVGQQKSSTLFANSLRIELPKMDENGNNMISTDLLLSNLGWQEQDIEASVRDLDLYVNETNAKLYDLAGRPNDDVPANQEVDVYWVSLDSSKMEGEDGMEMSSVIDGDTINFSIIEKGPNAAGLGGDQNSLRLASIDAPELISAFKSSPGLALRVDPTDPGVVSFLWLHSRLVLSTRDFGYSFAIRVNRNQSQEKYGRAIGWIFADAGDIINPELRKKTLMQWASSPYLGWDSYKANGQPYTLNYESVVSGNSNVYLYGLDKDLPDEGASYGALGGG